MRRTASTLISLGGTSLFLAGLALALDLAGCGRGTSGLPEQTARLAEQLRQEHFEVTAAGVVRPPYFSMPAHELRVGGETVQVFEYLVATMARAEALTVSQDGRSVATNDIALAGPPHFYAHDRLIALYVGSNPALQSALTRALGPPFAGEGVSTPGSEATGEVGSGEGEGEDAGAKEGNP